MYNPGYLTRNATGGWTLAAVGTNQPITLTPSGTGAVNIVTGKNLGALSIAGAVDNVGFTLQNSATGGLGFQIVSTGGTAGAGQGKWAILRGADNTAMLTLVSSSGNLLLGGLTTDGTGVLQFPLATTSAGGATFGNVNVFQSASSVLDVFANALTVAQFNGTQAAFRIGSGCTLQNQNGSVGTPSYGFIADTSTGMWYGGSTTLKFSTNGALALALDGSGNAQLTGRLTSYKGVTVAGWGVGAIQAAAEVTAQSAANASIATYTVGAADGTFRVSAQLDCTAATVLSTSLFVSYTDKGNTARTMIFPVAQLSGSFIAAGAITGTGAWETPVMHIRCKASTAITIGSSAGTFNTVTYSADAVIEQVA